MKIDKENPMYKYWMMFLRIKVDCWIQDNLVMHGEEYTKKLTSDDFYAENPIDDLWNDYIRILRKTAEELSVKG